MPITSEDMKNVKAGPHSHRLVEFDERRSTQAQRRQAEVLQQRLSSMGFRVQMCLVEGCDHVELVKSRSVDAPPGSSDKMLRPNQTMTKG